MNNEHPTTPRSDAVVTELIDLIQRLAYTLHDLSGALLDWQQLRDDDPREEIKQ